MKRRIYDGASIANMIQTFKAHFNDVPMKLTNKFIADNGTVYDADTVVSSGMYLEQQLKMIMPEILKQKFPGMVALDVIKNIDSSGTLAQALIQRMESYQGQHVDADSESDDAGELTFARTAQTIEVRTKKGHSNWSDINARRALMLNENIDEGFINVHNKSYMNGIDDAAFLGVVDSKGARVTGSYGLANYPNVIAGLRLDSDAVFSAYRDNKDGRGLYTQISTLVDAMTGAAGGVKEFEPTICILPPFQYSILKTVPYADIESASLTSKNVMTYLENNLGLKFYASNRCIGQGSGSTDRMIMLNNDMQNMKFFLPMPLEFLPVEYRGGNYILNSRYRVGGFAVNYDNAIAYLDSI